MTSSQPDAPPTLLDAVMKALDDTQCPRYYKHSDEACDGVSSCADCLRLAAEAVIAVLSRVGQPPLDPAHPGWTLPIPPDEPLRSELTALIPYVKHDTNCRERHSRDEDSPCICGATKALHGMQKAVAALRGALPPDRPTPAPTPDEKRLQEIEAGLRLSAGADRDKAWLVRKVRELAATSEVAESIAEVITVARKAARQHGYAIGVHGSLVRDVDLIAAPWTEEAVEPKVLAEAIRDAVGGFFRHDEPLGWPKPYGREGWPIYVDIHGTKATVLDLSVMPRAGGQPVSATPAEPDAAKLLLQNARSAIEAAEWVIGQCDCIMSESGEKDPKKAWRLARDRYFAALRAGASPQPEDSRTPPNAAEGK